VVYKGGAAPPRPGPPRPPAPDFPPLASQGGNPGLEGWEPRSGGIDPEIDHKSKIERILTEFVFFERFSENGALKPKMAFNSRSEKTAKKAKKRQKVPEIGASCALKLIFLIFPIFKRFSEGK
jgi:hypothetical protein